MTVQQLIETLQRMPLDLPVQLKVYGCGVDSWYDLEETTVQDMVNEDGDRICEIDVRNS